MTFEFELGDVSEVEIGADEYVVEFTLGFDLVSRERVSMAVALLESEDQGGADPFSLNFGLLKSPIDGGQTTGPYFDHATARQYVSRGNAPAVMERILVAINLLIDTVNPQEIAVSTFEENLPPAAMGKYYNVCNHLGRNGFGMRTYARDGTDLKDRWLFTR